MQGAAGLILWNCHKVRMRKSNGVRKPGIRIGWDLNFEFRMLVKPYKEAGVRPQDVVFGRSRNNLTLCSYAGVLVWE